MTPAALAFCQCCRRHYSCTDRSVQWRQHRRHLRQHCCRCRRLPREAVARRRRACADLLCTRRSRVLAKMVTWQRGTDAFCHSRTQAPALGARHCQRKSTALSRLQGFARRQTHGKTSFRPLSKIISRAAESARAQTPRAQPPWSETHESGVSSTNSQYSSDKRRGSSRWVVTDVDLYAHVARHHDPPHTYTVTYTPSAHQRHRTGANDVQTDVSRHRQ